MVHALIAADDARPDQGLMLPGPGLLAQVFGIGLDVADQRARASAGAQAHVRLVNPARAGVGGEDMDDALAQAGKKLAVVDGLGAVGGVTRVGPVQEDEVQIGTVAQFKPPQFAVGHHREPLVEGRVARRPGRAAVSGDQVVPGQADDFVQDDFGQIRKVVADPHERQDAGHVGRCHAQGVDLSENADGFDQKLEVVRWGLGHHRAQFGDEFGLFRRRVEGARVEQLIEQHGAAGDQRGNEMAGPGQLNQVLQGGRVFRQQGQIGRAAADAGENVDDARDGPVGRLGPRGRLQHLRQQSIEAPPGLGADFGALRLPAKKHQARPHVGRRRESGLPQQIVGLFGIQGFLPNAIEDVQPDAVCVVR